MLAPLLLAVLAADPTPTDAADAPKLDRPADAVPPDTLFGQPRQFFSGFEEADLTKFSSTDDDAWVVKGQGKNHVLALTVRKSDYTPPVRSPHNIALVDDLRLAETVIDVDVQSTITDYNHRDVCLFFGYLNAAQFYYVHLGKRADPHANQIFLVNGSDRRAISAVTTQGTPWDDEWHHARVVRFPAEGLIQVYFDDMTTPVMTARDTTFPFGKVGVGSFDDSAAFDNLAIYGTPAGDE